MKIMYTFFYWLLLYKNNFNQLFVYNYKFLSLYEIKGTLFFYNKIYLYFVGYSRALISGLENISGEHDTLPFEVNPKHRKFDHQILTKVFSS